MKLRNKKTGEIREWFNNTDGIFPNSLAELNKEWEDYEEQKEFYYITGDGHIVTGTSITENICRCSKEIGNYFETKEEAEKAVEKLKAFKRLRDRGFRFDGYNACSIDYDIDEQYRRYISEDLDLLFGGEE